MARARIFLKIGSDNKKRFFKFTISTMKRYDTDHGEDGAALQAMMANPMTALLKLSMYALDYPNNDNHLPENFDEEMLSDWIDDLNDRDLKTLVKTMMEALKKFGAVFTEQTETLQKPTK